MIRKALSLAVILFLSTTCKAGQDLVDRLHQAELKYGLPKNSLVALSLTESSLHWFALNIDGASFYPKSRQQALSIMRSVIERPYVMSIKANAESEPELWFFSTRQAAHKAVSQLGASPHYPEIIPQASGDLFRKLSLMNTGICALQISYRWHARDEGRSVADLLDPNFCIDYGAKYLAGLVRKHGFEKGVGCYYTCSNRSRARREREEYFDRYNRHFTRLNDGHQVATR